MVESGVPPAFRPRRERYESFRIQRELQSWRAALQANRTRGKIGGNQFSRSGEICVLQAISKSVPGQD